MADGDRLWQNVGERLPLAFREVGTTIGIVLDALMKEDALRVAGQTETAKKLWECVKEMNTGDPKACQGWSVGDARKALVMAMKNVIEVADAFETWEALTPPSRRL
jgi:hypothetical protein